MASPTGDTTPGASVSQCDLAGFYGDVLKPCASFASTVTDSGLGTGNGAFYRVWDCPLIVFAYVRSVLLRLGLETNKQAQERDEQKDFVPLYRDWEALFTPYIYRRLRDILNRPIAGCPGAHTDLKDRYTTDNCWNFQYPGTKQRVINLGSYNYLGFAQNDGQCAKDSIKRLHRDGLATCSSLHEFGKHSMHVRLEKRLAEFLQVEDALVYPMGFGTNTMNVPCLVDKNALVLSDELNHASLVVGCRVSEAKIVVFKHNDCHDLERKLIEAIRSGNPKTGERYSKILIVMEGLYSMEGTIPHLKEIVQLKKKYKAYLFLDEAHSIGSLGRTGRGCSEYWGVRATDIDVLMGTFTKSFSAAGGYIAGTRVLSVIELLSDLSPHSDGLRRLTQLRANTRYFRRQLKRAGFLVYGNDDSPVIPTLLYFPAKVALFSRALLKLGIGVVVVGFPATPIATERARFCMSSGHTKKDLDYALSCIIKCADLCEVRYFKPRRVGPIVLNSLPPLKQLEARDDYYNSVYKPGSEKFDWIFDQNDLDPDHEGEILYDDNDGDSVVFE